MKRNAALLGILFTFAAITAAQHAFHRNDRTLAKTAAIKRLDTKPPAPSRPAEIAQKWLVDLDNAPTSPFPNMSRMPDLPDVSIWPEIERQVRDRIHPGKRFDRDLCTLAFVQTLLGERKEAWATLDRLISNGGNVKAAYNRVVIDLALTEERPDWIETAYRRKLSPENPYGKQEPLDVSDALAILPAKFARKLLTHLFQTYDGVISVLPGTPNQAIARDVALAGIKTLKHPQWALADDIDGHALFAAMYAQFPHESPAQQSFQWPDKIASATVRYAAFLIANNRYKEAIAFDESMVQRMALYGKPGLSSWFSWRLPSDEIERLKRTGKAANFKRFVERIAKRDGDATIVAMYESLCDSLGEAPHFRKFVHSLPPKARGKREVDDDAKDLIREGKLAEAGKLLKASLTDPAVLKSLPRSHPNTASLLVGIGRVLHRPDWVTAGLNAEKASIVEEPNLIDASICFSLAKNGRTAEGEAILLDRIKAAKEFKGFSSPPPGQRELADLVRLYVTTDRFAEAAALLDKSPSWGAGDIADFEMTDTSIEVPFPVIAAQALVRVGRGTEAIRPLRYTLWRQNYVDQAYALLVDVDPAAGAFLDQMHLAAPMEARPLMWKAEWLRRHHQLKEAETLIYRAVALDPEDILAVERNTRFQVYGILAAIERDRGKNAAAKVHQAIYDGRQKLSHLWNLNNDKFAFKSLSDKLKDVTKSPDDYFLRQVVADDLMEMGRRDEAKKQTLSMFRSFAAKLGPGSLVGWVTIHEGFLPDCEKLFKELVQKSPNSASLYSAMGIVYQFCDEDEKAIHCLRKSLELDNHFGPSWTALEGIGREAWLPVAVRDQISLAQLRNSPGNSRFYEGRSRDLRALWLGLQPTTTIPASANRPVFPLSASASALTELQRGEIQTNVIGNDLPAPIFLFTKDQTVNDFLNLLAAERGVGPSS